ncbi:DinB family protein [Kroppenstedtia pulmonis]|uniref:DinB family protein n=1 Tax=Kroppenstedtia pulmonis TaxID=1380685 RepID=A0A7D4CE86_9BACL|nr:DinB family protein [Kroppenstedtia pulmonis]QKG83674.1 DinB family protein [Kroppenstedtia pulmonis]
MDQAVFKQMEWIRNQLTVKLAEETNPEILDRIPSGFNNSIRWNLGHILHAQEQMVFGLAGEQVTLPESYEGLFGNGTKPGDWTTEPPSLETLIDALKEQPARIQQAFSDRLETPLVKPFLSYETIGEIISFSLFHEGVHIGVIKGLQNALKGER